MSKNRHSLKIDLCQNSPRAHLVKATLFTKLIILLNLKKFMQQIQEVGSVIFFNQQDFSLSSFFMLASLFTSLFLPFDPGIYRIMVFSLSSSVGLLHINNGLVSRIYALEWVLGIKCIAPSINFFLL